MTIGLSEQEVQQDLLSQLRGGEHRLYPWDGLAIAEAVARSLHRNNERLEQDLRRLGVLGNTRGLSG
jgi:hypothetical protein